MRHLHTFHSSCTIYYFLPTVSKASDLSTFSPTLVSLSFLTIAILTRMRWYLIEFFIFIALIIRVVELFVINLLTIYLLSLEKCPFKLLVNFKIRLIFSALELCGLDMYFRYQPFKIHVVQIFSHICIPRFHSVADCLCCAKAF